MLFIMLFVISKVVLYSTTSVWNAANHGFLAVSPQVTLVIKPVGRLTSLSTRHAVTFPAKEILPFGRYKIILLGDRGTQV